VLLDRQYFGGPMWDGKKKPTKQEDDVENVLAAYDDEEDETHPSKIKKADLKKQGDGAVGLDDFYAVITKKTFE